MATDYTEWPSPTFPAAVRNLISLFYSLIESQSDDAGLRLATEVFTPGGVMQAGAQKFTGSKELRASRISAWTHVATRKHAIRKVYAASVNSVGSDLMMLGRLDLLLRNGASLSMDFAARIVVDDALSVQPKIELCQVWADSAPLIRAIAGIDDGGEWG